MSAPRIVHVTFAARPYFAPRSGVNAHLEVDVANPVGTKPWSAAAECVATAAAQDTRPGGLPATGGRASRGLLALAAVAAALGGLRHRIADVSPAGGGNGQG